MPGCRLVTALLLQRRSVEFDPLMELTKQYGQVVIPNEDEDLHLTRQERVNRHMRTPNLKDPSSNNRSKEERND
jgi:hypothetical protein